MGLSGLIRNAARDPRHGARARRNAQHLATAPPALNPITGQITLETYIESTIPASGNIGRLIFVSDTEDIRLDIGSEWKVIDFDA